MLQYTINQTNLIAGAMSVALGSAAAGVFTNSAALWELMHKAGAISGDRVWRMPLWRHYSSQITGKLIC